jgi:predicted porin
MQLKRLLLGSSALVAGSLGALHAQAQQVTTKATSLSISGTAEAYGGYVHSDDPAVDRHFDMVSVGDFTFTPQYKLDNGLTVTGRLDFKVEDTLATDELSLTFASASFGTILLGNDDGPSEDWQQYAPLSGDGAWDGDAPDFASGIAPDDLLNGGDTSDATKISYTTKGLDLAGFGFGVSYAPDGHVNDFDSGDLSRTTGDNGVEVAGGWKGSIGDVGVKTGAVYYSASSGPGGGGSPGNVNLGGTLTYAGVSVGGDYNWMRDVGGTDGDGSTWSAGITYEKDNWAVGTGYLNVRYDEAVLSAPGNTRVEGDNYYVGGSYDIAPGITGLAEVNQYRNAENKLDATVVFFGTKVAF